MNNKRRKWKAWQLGLLGCGAITLLGAICVLVNYTLQERPPERSFKIEKLLIDETSLPPEWKASMAGPRPPSNAPLGGQTSIERIILGFTNSDGVAVEEIHRYTNTKAAAREFERVVPIELPSGEHWSTWQLPEGFSYQSPYAARFKPACARETWKGVTIEFCRMVGQYEEYIVRFSTKISPSYMTYKDFEKVVQAIDDRMGYYLGKKKTFPTP